jgi:hypothetical protein
MQAEARIRPEQEICITERMSIEDLTGYAETSGLCLKLLLVEQIR